MLSNVTVTHDAPIYLKQSVPMMVVYTLAYSAVFFLGISLTTSIRSLDMYFSTTHTAYHNGL